MTAADDESSPTPGGAGTGRRTGGLPPVVGRKHVRAAKRYLADLRRLYPHPDRKPFYDDVVVAHLLAFFNPSIRSLRCLEDVTRTPAVNRFLSVEAVCRSTPSDANALLDPAHPTGLVAHVRARLPRAGRVADPDLDRLLGHPVDVDGSYFRTAADVQRATWHRKGAAEEPTRRHLRLNVAFCQATGVPVGVGVNGDDGEGEGAAAARLIAAPAGDGGVGDPHAERAYAFDSGVVSFGLLDAILGRGERVPCNLKSQVGFAAERDLPLTDRDRAAGVASDRVGRLAGSNKHTPPAGPLREVVVPYADRAGKARRVRILTDLLDLPAHLAAELYKHRWQVGLFFRWLKVHANYRHPIGASRNGVTTGFYVAVPAAMLLQPNTGRPPDEYAPNLFGLVANGLADPADVLPILARRDREKRLARERLARKRSEKTAA